MTYYPTKCEAVKAVAALGYVTGEDINGDGYEGESGDHGWGSRLYFHLPSHGYAANGLALVHCTVSQVGREWATSFFGGR